MALSLLELGLPLLGRRQLGIGAQGDRAVGDDGAVVVYGVEVGAEHRRSGEVRLLEVGLGEVGISQIGAEELGFCTLGSVQDLSLIHI